VGDGAVQEVYVGEVFTSPRGSVRSNEEEVIINPSSSAKVINNISSTQALISKPKIATIQKRSLKDKYTVVSPRIDK
jgi:hypothetical protein